MLCSPYRFIYNSFGSIEFRLTFGCPYCITIFYSYIERASNSLECNSGDLDAMNPFALS